MTTTTPTTPPDPAVVAALLLTLGRYPWRSWTPHLLARLALGQWDRAAVERLLASVPGTVPGAWHEVEPASAEDPRAELLVAFLTAHRWTDFTVSAVCRRLLGLLDDPAREP